MIKYWPNKQGIQLNNSVVNLFYDTRKKFIHNLSNNTNYYLCTDLLNNIYKKKLFNIILEELEKLILDIIELNLNKKNLRKLNYQILCDFINKISNNFISNKETNNNEYLNKNHYTFYNFSNLLLKEHKILIENLLIYLIFGSSMINNNIFIFNKYYTPYQHVQILFENFIIQSSNFIMSKLFNKFLSLSELIHFLKKNEICNSSYISTRSIALLLNNLQWQNIIYSYIYFPKLIYSARYQVWLFSSQGIITKYIYLFRLKEGYQLSQIQMILLFFIEFKDICIPKIEKFFIITIKYLIYIIINIISSLIILITRIIISYIYK
uniref:Ycf55 n=1 Tax=Dasya binghamiae TaxID=1896963 RepID=A0A1C8XRU8_9FLOR|nr:hypothetical protein BI108_pgp187 [Dasya binghamiae]AOH77220.1 hypothetical protein [Dasya binghamiae]